MPTVDGSGLTLSGGGVLGFPAIAVSGYRERPTPENDLDDEQRGAAGEDLEQRSTRVLFAERKSWNVYATRVWIAPTSSPLAS
jgi:hypothetical protein